MKMKLANAIFFLSCVFTTNGYLKTKPDWIKTCRFSDPNFKKCSTQSIQKLFEKLATGIEGLDTVETIDPLKLNRIKIIQGDGPVSINASLTKVTVTGFGKTKVVENIVDPKDFSWKNTIYLPKMRIEGHYNMNGRILIVPLNGKGRCWLEPEKLNIVLNAKTELYGRDEHVFYNVTETKVHYTLKGLKLNFENLFEGAKALEDGTNRYLNDNWNQASEALRPIITKTIEDILLDLLQKIFHYMPGSFFVADLPKP